MRNSEVYSKIKCKFDNLSKPLDSLGEFEDVICRMGAVLDDEAVDISKASLVVFCSDNGIIEEGVSQSGSEVTLSITTQLGTGCSSVCHMAKLAGVDVKPVNLGLKDAVLLPGVENQYFIAPGTNNFSKEPAMSEDELELAIKAGENVVERLWLSGKRCLLLGEMGIGNTTTSSAVIAAILKIFPEDIVGRGSGLSDEGLEKKIKVIKKAFDKYDLYGADPLKVLRTVGGFDIAAMVGSIFKASELGMPVILDGLITCAGAIVATTVRPETRDVLFFSHKGRENGIMLVAEDLNMNPVIDGDLALGEGTGAVLFYQLLKCAKAVYDNGTTFEEANIEAYERFE